jgi:lipopolysaccharide/colanic/teichoic acid biosynthesis glycosyltransferase
MYQYFFKRSIDFVISLLGLVMVTPIILITIILLSFVNKGKPFFFQIRPGFNEKLFKIVKFKTMSDAKDADGNLLPDNERMTKVGNLVRKTSLDELPQLWSVLKGDMSLIGPRPLLPEYLPLYNSEQKKTTYCETWHYGLGTSKW